MILAKKRKRLPVGYGFPAFIVLFCIMLCAGCAMQRDVYAGRINGMPIKRQDFMNSLRGHFTGFMLENDRTPDENEKKELYKQTWRSITIHVVLEEHFKNYDIQVSQSEVIDTLLKTVPESILRAPLFQVNGLFDRGKYVNMIVTPEPGPLDWLKQYYYDYQIPISKLKIALQKDAVINKKELHDLLKIMNSTADINWIVFDPAKADVTVSNAEIENYYHSNLDDFRIIPQLRLGWSRIEVVVNEQDRLWAKAKIDSIYSELIQGKPFSHMAEQLSQSNSSKFGGDLGFVKMEELPKITQLAISDLDNLQITKPLHIDDSWVIYQKVEQTKTMVKLREIVINILPSEQNINSVKQRAIHLRDLALQLGLQTAAEEMDYIFVKTDKMSREEIWLPDVEASAYLADRALTQMRGALLEPVYSHDMRAWILVEVIDIQPHIYKPIVSVIDEITRILQSDKQNRITLDIARDFSIKNRDNQLAAALRAGITVINSKALAIEDSVMSQPINSFYVDIISDFNSKKLPNPVSLGDNVLLPIVMNVRQIQPPKYSQADARTYYFSSISPDWFEKWLNKELTKANVKIWFTYP